MPMDMVVDGTGMPSLGSVFGTVSPQAMAAAKVGVISPTSHPIAPGDPTMDESLDFYEAARLSVAAVTMQDLMQVEETVAMPSPPRKSLKRRGLQKAASEETPDRGKHGTYFKAKRFRKNSRSRRLSAKNLNTGSVSSPQLLQRQKLNEYIVVTGQLFVHIEEPSKIAEGILTRVLQLHEVKVVAKAASTSTLMYEYKKLLRFDGGSVTACVQIHELEGNTSLITFERRSGAVLNYVRTVHSLLKGCSTMVSLLHGTTTDGKLAGGGPIGLAGDRPIPHPANKSGGGMGSPRMRLPQMLFDQAVSEAGINRRVDNRTVTID